ncbi:MAG: helix-turn-helix transcriptional regulator [Cyclobacteriaceae bacterium]|nr:helix-turn-helix transcriptional regulator [Cyclobacteriaceae bacterium]
MKPKDKKRLQKFRQNLTRIRKEKGLSQRALSYQCDIGHAKISRLESSDNENLTLPTLFEIAKGLGVHPKELIDYEFEFLKK